MMNKYTKLLMLSTLAFATCSMRATVPMNEREAHAIKLLHEGERLLWGDVITMDVIFNGPKKDHEQEALAKIRAALDTQYLPYKEQADALWELGSSYERKRYEPQCGPKNLRTITTYLANTEKALEYFRKAVIAQQESIKHEQGRLEGMQSIIRKNEDYENSLAIQKEAFGSSAQ